MAPLSPSDVKQLHLADVTLPQGHPLEGETCPVYGHVVQHPQGIVVFDTGIGEGQPGIEALYKPVRRPLAEHLAALAIDPADVSLVIDSHLHFDHCGDNRLFRDSPIYAQRAEYAAAQEPAYTVREWVEFPGARYELLDGESQVLPGVTIIPTPGHTAGHHSAVLETSEGRVILAGQAAYSATEFADPEGTDPRLRKGSWDEDAYLASISRLHNLDPRGWSTSPTTRRCGEPSSHDERPLAERAAHHAVT